MLEIAASLQNQGSQQKLHLQDLLTIKILYQLAFACLCIFFFQKSTRNSSLAFEIQILNLGHLQSGDSSFAIQQSILVQFFPFSQIVHKFAEKIDECLCLTINICVSKPIASFCSLFLFSLMRSGTIKFFLMTTLHTSVLIISQVGQVLYKICFMVRTESLQCDVSDFSPHYGFHCRFHFYSLKSQSSGLWGTDLIEESQHI